MKIEINTLFGVGEIVKFKGAEQRFLINNVITETCPGGTQILYDGAILFPKDTYRTERKIEYFFDKSLRVNENLLEKII